MKNILKKNIVIIGLTFLIPGIISFLIKDSFAMYKSLVQPKFSPPAYFFPIAWSVLYLLMSIAAILTKENDKCLKLYYLQLFFNIIWTPIFFLFKNYLLALIDLLVLLGTVLCMTYKFFNENNKTKRI